MSKLCKLIGLLWVLSSEVISQNASIEWSPKAVDTKTDITIATSVLGENEKFVYVWYRDSRKDISVLNAYHKKDLTPAATISFKEVKEFDALTLREIFFYKDILITLWSKEKKGSEIIYAQKYDMQLIKEGPFKEVCRRTMDDEHEKYGSKSIFVANKVGKICYETGIYSGSSFGSRLESCVIDLDLTVSPFYSIAMPDIIAARQPLTDHFFTDDGELFASSINYNEETSQQCITMLKLEPEKKKIASGKLELTDKSVYTLSFAKKDGKTFLTGIFGNYNGKNDSLHGAYFAELNDNLEASDIKYFRIKKPELELLNKHSSEKREKLTKFLFDDVKFYRMGDSHEFMVLPLSNLKISVDYFDMNGSEIIMVCSKAYQGRRGIGSYGTTKKWEDSNYNVEGFSPVLFSFTTYNLNSEIMIFKYDLVYGFSWVRKIDRFAYYDHPAFTIASIKRWSNRYSLATKYDVSVFRRSNDLTILYNDMFQSDGTMIAPVIPDTKKDEADYTISSVNIANISVGSGNTNFDKVNLSQRVNMSNFIILSNKPYLEHDGKGFGRFGRFEY